MKALSPKEHRFVIEYIKDQNGTQAAIRAGYSKKSARRTAYSLTTKPHIKAAIDGYLRKAAKAAVIDKTFFLNTINEVVARGLQKVPVMEFDHENKELVQKQEYDSATGKMVGVWECDLAAVNGANRLAGQFLKLLTDKVEVEVTNALADRIKAARERKSRAK